MKNLCYVVWFPSLQSRHILIFVAENSRSLTFFLCRFSNCFQLQSSSLPFSSSVPWSSKWFPVLLLWNWLVYCFLPLLDFIYFFFLWHLPVIHLPKFCCKSLLLCSLRVWRVSWDKYVLYTYVYLILFLTMCEIHSSVFSQVWGT